MYHWGETFGLPSDFGLTFGRDIMSGELTLPLHREESLGYQVNHLARLLEQALRERIHRHGVVPGQFAQLLALYEEEPLTQSQLCERIEIGQPTMANTLQRMQRDGLIERTADPGDRRRAQIVLTPHARALEGPLTSAARQVNGLATRGLSEPEVASLMATIRRMITNLTTTDPLRQL